MWKANMIDLSYWPDLIGTVLITFCLFDNFGLDVERLIPLEIELWPESELCLIGILIGVDFVGWVVVGCIVGAVSVADFAVAVKGIDKINKSLSLHSLLEVSSLMFQSSQTKSSALSWASVRFWTSLVCPWWGGDNWCLADNLGKSVVAANDFPTFRRWHNVRMNKTLQFLDILSVFNVSTDMVL